MIHNYRNAFGSFNRNVKLMLTYYALNNVANGVISVLLNLYFLKIGLNENYLGSTVFVQSLSLGLLALPFGMLADRIPKEKMIKLSYLLINVPYTGFLLFKDPIILLGLFVLQGVGSAMAAGAEIPYLTENTSTEARAYLFSLNTAMYLGGPVLGMAVGGYLPRLFGGILRIAAESADAYRMALVCSVVLFWTAGAAVLAIRRSPLIESAPSPGPRRLSLKFSNPGIVLGLSLNRGIISLAASMFLPFASVIMNQQFEMPSHVIGWVLTAQSLATSAGTLMVPTIAKKRGNLAAATILQAMAIPFYVTLALAPNSGVFSLAYIVRGMLASMPYPLMETYMMESVGAAERGAANAALNLVRYVLWAFGGKIGGALLGQKSFSTPMLLASGVYTLGVCVLVVMLVHGRLRFTKHKGLA